MKIIQWNDLHIDVSKFDLSVFTAEDIASFTDCTLVVAGDVCSNWRDGYLEFLREVAPLFQHVVAVFGNHEYWDQDIMADITARRHMSKLQVLSDFPQNVHLLTNSEVEIDGVVFLGGTLWTDLNQGNPSDVMVAEYHMKDFQYIYAEDGGFDKITPDLWMALHSGTKLFIEKALARIPASKKVVVVTHHAPCYLSIHKDYKNEDTNSSYYSDLSRLIMDVSDTRPDGWRWLHGHTHHAVEYKLSTCTITCNPRGYQSEKYQEDTGFDPLKVLEV